VGEGSDIEVIVAGVRSGLAQLVREQVHQQPVMPRPVEIALVATHDPDRPEPDRGVGPDGALVGGGRVDRQAMVAAGLDQPSGDRPDRIGPEAAILRRPREDDVDPGVAIPRIRLS
jgi:hypothetical protein